MTRRADWKARLVDYLAASAQRPFRYGQHDCALFAAGAVAAMTGTDHADGWRGYGDLPSGLRRLRAAGHDDHVAFVASILPEIHPVRAMPGDVAVMPGDGGVAALGIVQGAGVYALRPQGIAVLPRGQMLRAFRV